MEFHFFYVDSQNSHMVLVLMTVYLCNTMQTLLTHQPHFKVADGGKNFHGGEEQAFTLKILQPSRTQDFGNYNVLSLSLSTEGL